MEDVESKLYFMSTPIRVNMGKALEEASEILRNACLPENYETSRKLLEEDVNAAPTSYQDFPLILEISPVRGALNKAYFDVKKMPREMIDPDNDARKYNP